MATMPMLCPDQEVPHSVDYEAGTSREETQELTAQEMYNGLPDTSLHDCRVEMVPLDAIYVEGDQQEDDLVNALAHSIGLIGLQNPVCVIDNDIPEHPAKYRLVSGKKRLAAFLKLKRTTIPAHILSYAETDSEKEVRKALATTEENLVRKHYSLIELCELLGQSKAMYERIHPDAMYGKAKKKRDSGTESLQPVSYLTHAATQLKKSKTTIWKYVCIYGNLIQGHPQEFAVLKQCDHPILAKVEDLLELAQSEDIETLTRLLCGLGLTPDDRKSKPCTLQEAQKRLAQYRAPEAPKSQPSQPNGPEHPQGQEIPPQPCNPTMPPPAEKVLVITPQPEVPAGVDPSSDEVLDTVEEVLIALERQITRYVDVHAPRRFTRFRIDTHKKGANELHVIVEERA